MADFEGIQAGAAELTLLRSDLAELFVANAGRVAIHQPDDLEQQAELALAGTYGATGSRPHEIQVWQRFQSGQPEYFVISLADKNPYRCQISGGEAHNIWHGKPPMTLDDVMAVRRWLWPGRVEWDAEATGRTAEALSPFNLAERNY